LASILFFDIRFGLGLASGAPGKKRILPLDKGTLWVDNKNTKQSEAPAP
jgi:hypothetical protein